MNNKLNKFVLLTIGLILLGILSIGCNPFAQHTPSPASFTLDDLIISPTSIQVGNDVKVSTTVSNNGEREGICHLILKIDGTEIISTDVTLEPNQTKVITFSQLVGSLINPGIYSIDVNGKTGYVSVFSNNTANTAPKTVTVPNYGTRSIPSGATAICRDGTYSYSQNRRGT